MTRRLSLPSPRRAACLALALAALSVSGCDREKPADRQGAEAGKSAQKAPDAPRAYTIDRSRAGTPAPTATFASADDAQDGPRTSLADFRGAPVLLNLWATWCVPCLKEMPTLDALAARTRGKLAVVAVAQDLKGAEVVRPWFTDAGLQHLDAWIDPDNALLDDAGTPLPTTILYNAEGIEVLRVVGALDWNGAEAAALLREAGMEAAN